MTSKSPQFFCDLPLADINAITCSANRFLYHGSPHGVFGKMTTSKRHVDIHEIDAFRVKLEHLSSDPLDDQYQYHLVYISKDIYQQVWKGCKKRQIPGMRKFVSETKLSADAKTHPFGPGNFLHLSDDKPIVFSPYEESHTSDNYVPNHYQATLRSKFESILLRTKSECRLFFQLLQAHGLKVVDQLETTDEFDGNLKVECFAA
ncbi:hypothetical protein [Rubritalea tangerina]|uniref:Uncharacterized protein n=1 Tax=Rubritalea tangerina TaxID=430798 RepID=A0ABW4Z809_9BACT